MTLTILSKAASGSGRTSDPFFLSFTAFDQGFFRAVADA